MPDTAPLDVTIPDHELIRPIGRGSYGEVWLARSVLGERRAVKIVRASAFDDPRPFEREFAGLQKFEPISRSHPGLVHVLHAGRFPGGFYYVMELADDAAVPGRGSSTATTDGYTPHTLRVDLRRRERLPVAECVELGMRLTEALSHLHGHGLVHRDLKPSNVIFVHGQPKLADIGLVTLADATMSCVGTEGYLPPEGPGKPPADLYALGKVLYELATGRDRTDFPELPTLLREDPGREALEELNEVILKACEPDARRRYQTAREMSADLALLQRGQSLRWRRSMTRRVAMARMVGGLGVVTAGVAAGAYGWQRAQTRDARRLRALAEDLAARAQIQHAEDLFARGESALALAHLARVLRRDHAHPIASERLWWALKLRQFPRPVAPPLIHPTRIASARFSPDGRQVVTLARDNHARIWDPRTGAERLPSIAHPAPVNAMAFSPDGRWLVTASDDALARILDLREGGAVRELSHPKAVRAVDVSPTGAWLATGSADRQARVFALDTGQPRHSPLGHEHSVDAVAFSPDSRWLATLTEPDGAIRLWNLDSGRLDHLLKVEGYPNQIRFSRDGRRLAASWQHRTTHRWQVQVWDLTTNPPSSATLPHQHRIYTLAFAPDGQRLVVPTADNQATVWNLSSDGLSSQVQFTLAHSALVNAAQFSPDGRHILTASVDQTARLWDAPTGAVASEAMRHEGRVIHAEFDVDGSRVLTASWDRTVRLWDARPRVTDERGFELTRPVVFAEFSPDSRELVAGTGQALFTVARNNRWNIGGPQQLAIRDASSPAPGRLSSLPAKAGIVTARFTTHGVRVLISDQDLTRERALAADHEFSESARIWDPTTSTPVGSELRFEHDINCAHFSRDGAKVVTGTTRGKVRVWDARGLPVTEPLTHPGGIMSVRFNEAATHVVSASRDGTAMIWDAVAGTPLAGPLLHGAEVSLAQFSPRGDRLVTISPDNSARLWAVDGRLVHELPHGAPVEHAEFSPDGAKLVTAAGLRAQVWDVATGRLLVESMTHRELVLTARFSPDNRRLLTASFDRTAQLWHAETGLKLSEPLTHGDRLTAASFSPDGQRVLTAGFDGSVKVWNLPPALSPDWLPELAEAVGGLRLTEVGLFTESVGWSERNMLRTRLTAGANGATHAAWARSLLNAE